MVVPGGNAEVLTHLDTIYSGNFRLILGPGTIFHRAKLTYGTYGSPEETFEKPWFSQLFGVPRTPLGGRWRRWLRGKKVRPTWLE